jgi:hypothetical protein
LAADVQNIRQRLVTYEQEELPVRRAAWEQTLRQRILNEPATLRDGLIAHYPLDEKTGLRVANAVPGRPSGFLGSLPEGVPGVLSGAVRLNGDTAHFDCGSAFNPDRTDHFSYGCWFLSAETENEGALFANRGIFGGGNRGTDLWRESDGRIAVHLMHEWPFNAIKVVTLDPIPTQEWHHVFATYDGSSAAAGVQIYVDGKSVRTTIEVDTLSGSIQSNLPFRIGMVPHIRGQIDDVRIYERELASKDVWRLYETSVNVLASVPQDKRTPQQQELLSRFVNTDNQPRESRLELPSSLKEGLVAHYPLDEIDEVGVTPNAAAGRPNGVWDVDRLQWSPGVVDGALWLNGEHGHFSFGDAYQPERTRPMTLGCWINCAADSKRGVVFGKFDQEAGRGFCVNVDASQKNVFCEWTHRFLQNCLIVFAENLDLSEQWRHLCVTYDGSSSSRGVMIYLDGVAVANRTTVDTLSETIETPVPVQMGTRGGAYRFRGGVDDLRVYDRVLPPGQVKQLFESGLQKLAQVPGDEQRPQQRSLLARFSDSINSISKPTGEFPASLSEGLVLHYPFDETEGEMAASALAGRPNGLYRNPGSEWVPGVVGGALRLYGTGAHVNCGKVFDPERTDEFSYGCWFLSEKDGQLAALLGKTDDGNLFQGFDLFLFRRQLGARLIHQEHLGQDTDSRIAVFSREESSVGRWHHVMMTYDGSSTAAGVTIYVSGRVASKQVYTDNFLDTIRNDAPFHIGMRDKYYPFKGRIDDVRVYDRRLSEDEIVSLYNSDIRALTCVPADDRVPHQQELLEEVHRSQDKRLAERQRELASAEDALKRAQWEGVRRWYVNGQGQTMIVIPAGKADQQIVHSYAISSHEVTVGEYQRFDDQIGTSATSPTEQCPITGRTWYEAAEYCNWLSRQEGIPEGQWVYEPNDQAQFAEGMTIRENFRDLRGYRLPSEDEWDYACRAGTVGTYSFGEPVLLLVRYGYGAENSAGKSYSVGTRLPNAAGLFDCHGNASEWVQDSTAGDLAPLDNDVSRVIRGAAYYHGKDYLRSSYRYGSKPSGGVLGLGFRVARSHALSQSELPASRGAEAE